MGLVRLAHLADLDLDSIRDFIAQHNPRAANDVLDLLFNTLERLADEPELGERRNDLAQNLRAFVVRPYVISIIPHQTEFKLLASFTALEIIHPCFRSHDAFAPGATRLDDSSEERPAAITSPVARTSSHSPSLSPAPPCNNPPGGPFTSTAHEELAAFQQFALQKVNPGEADTLEELFDLWLIEHPTPEEQVRVHARVLSPRLVHPEQIADFQMEVCRMG